MQGHIGSGWVDGQYERVRKLSDCKFFFEDFMARLQTDYVDIGMIHFVDSEEDYASVFDTELIDYCTKLKKDGVIRTLGMSSHNPVQALRAVKTGLIDVLMFSINAAYDSMPEETELEALFAAENYQKSGLKGINPVRAELYRTCEAMGVGITVMKGLAAGALLKAETSPFGAAMTPEQCVHYALTRPAVASVMYGARTPEEVACALRYEEATDAEKDYSSVLKNAPKYSMKGKCMYCNHCLPCPSHIDVAQVNKFLDLAELSEKVPDTVRAHYLALEHSASECIACGSCEGNCPFSVPVIERMQRAAELFGK